MRKPTSEEIDYHAARLLLLIYHCGIPAAAPQIKGRTLLAKLDFFLRYPAYLERAAQIRSGKGLRELIGEGVEEFERDNVETHMVRYKYGPWDNIYYLVLAYLVAKDLVKVEVKRQIEYYGLTETGKEVAALVSRNAAFAVLVARALALRKLFPRWNGTNVKNFIYENFTEVVSLPLGKEI